MKSFIKGLLIAAGCIAAIPVLFMLLSTLSVFLISLLAAPGVWAIILGILGVVSIPGIIIGIIVSKHNK